MGSGVVEVTILSGEDKRRINHGSTRISTDLQEFFGLTRSRGRAIFAGREHKSGNFERATGRRLGFGIYDLEIAR